MLSVVATCVIVVLIMMKPSVGCPTWTHTVNDRRLVSLGRRK